MTVQIAERKKERGENIEDTETVIQYLWGTSSGAFGSFTCTAMSPMLTFLDPENQRWRIKFYCMPLQNKTKITKNIIMTHHTKSETRMTASVLKQDQNT